MSKIYDGLYLGFWETTKEKKWIREKNISHIISCAPAVGRYFPADLKYKLIPILDCDTFDPLPHFDDAVDAIVKCYEAQDCTGVQMHGFKIDDNRPLACMLCYLMREKQMNLINASKFLVSKAPDTRLAVAWQPILKSYEHDCHLKLEIKNKQRLFAEDFKKRQMVQGTMKTEEDLEIAKDSNEQFHKKDSNNVFNEEQSPLKINNLLTKNSDFQDEMYEDIRKTTNRSKMQRSEARWYRPIDLLKKNKNSTSVEAVNKKPAQVKNRSNFDYVSDASQKNSLAYIFDYDRNPGKRWFQQDPNFLSERQNFVSEEHGSSSQKFYQPAVNKFVATNVVNNKKLLQGRLNTQEVHSDIDKDHLYNMIPKNFSTGEKKNIFLGALKLRHKQMDADGCLSRSPTIQSEYRNSYCPNLGQSNSFKQFKPWNKPQNKEELSKTSTIFWQNLPKYNDFFKKYEQNKNLKIGQYPIKTDPFTISRTDKYAESHQIVAKMDHNYNTNRVRTKQPKTFTDKEEKWYNFCRGFCLNQSTLNCAYCDTILCTQKQVIPHALHWLRNCNFQKKPDMISYDLTTTSRLSKNMKSYDKLEVPQGLQPKDCNGVFFRTPEWMRFNVGDNGGDVKCPNCQCVVGKAKLSGVKCCCGHWNVPGYQQLKRHVNILVK